MSFHPQTPQSPSQFSPGTSSEQASTNLSTSMASTATLPTPAHSVSGASYQPESAMTDDTPNKRKRSVEDVGDREGNQKKPHLEERKLGIDDLHCDVGIKHLLCQTPHPESLPRTSEDLYEAFNLTGLAAEVAREKPNGEKNALRKTYKGHIKRLGVAGHFDVQKKKEGTMSEFLSMVSAPELEWNVHEVKGREITDGLSEITLSSLARALTMSKGPIPKTVWDTSVLGDLSPAGGDGSKSSSMKPTAPGTPLSSASASMNRPKPQGAQMQGHDPTRPRRNIKKRAYGDNSYEGYSETYADEDTGMDTGYSTGEGEGGQKRRKKNPGSTQGYPNTMRQQSYGPGMVGA
ncbi:Rox3 mediator complex subunit-domain-containing protein [Stachybotrys elegans]|uniref:Mediator of RNA polymerase II transcription subunit 19 n=1 Tax=Stachybotrys elegans TaxID=80388 RepID=A0A8K0SRW2_9HYPO|nr:Rox3 mediator complex subunit-domain-containing protein [Stachybotrys elegans]